MQLRWELRLSGPAGMQWAQRHLAPRFPSQARSGPIDSERTWSQRWIMACASVRSAPSAAPALPPSRRAGRMSDTWVDSAAGLYRLLVRLGRVVDGWAEAGFKKLTSRGHHHHRVSAAASCGGVPPPATKSGATPPPQHALH